MRIIFPLIASVFCLSVTGSAWANDPSQVDPAKRNETFAPGATITPEARPLQKDDAVQGRRARLPAELVEKTTADALQEQRAPIELKESKEKAVKDKDVRTFPKIKEPTSRWSDKKPARQPTDTLRKPLLVSKYQDRMKAAAAAAATRQPTVERRSSFEGLNRFVFRRNVARDERPVAIPAGGGTSPRAQP